MAMGATTYVSGPSGRDYMDTGVFERGHVPRGWRALCGVDRFGEPVGPELSLPLPAASAS